MKKILIILTASFLLTNIVYGQSEEIKSLNEFYNGERSKFSSFGQGKSQGLKIHFKYPNSWNSIEGERPHIVRKFKQSDNSVIALILVNKAEESFSKSDVEVTLSQESLKSLLPSTASYITGNSNLKIEGLKASSLEFTNRNERVNMSIYTHNMHYYFFYNQYFISIQFTVSSKYNESNSSVDSRYKAVKPLFDLMFNSTVIDNIWE